MWPRGSPGAGNSNALGMRARVAGSSGAMCTNCDDVQHAVHVPHATSAVPCPRMAVLISPSQAEKGPAPSASVNRLSCLREGRCDLFAGVVDDPLRQQLGYPLLVVAEFVEDLPRVLTWAVGRPLYAHRRVREVDELAEHLHLPHDGM